MDNRLPDGLNDESNDVQTEGNYPGSWNFKKFGPAVFLGTFTMDLTGWMDRMDNGQTDRWADFQVESPFNSQTDESCN